MAELVAGEAKHLQAAVFVLGIERLQPFILRREPAFARGVDDQQDLALVIAEVLVAAIVQLRGKVVQAHCKCLLGRYFLPRRTRRARRSPKKTTESERQLSKRESDITIDLLWREILRFPASCEGSQKSALQMIPSLPWRFRDQMNFSVNSVCSVVRKFPIVSRVVNTLSRPPRADPPARR